MLRKFKAFVIAIMCLVAIVPALPTLAQANLLITQPAASVPIPTITTINPYEPTSHATPFISGYTAPGTEVLVYIDGTFAGLVEQAGQNGSVDNYFFYPDKMIAAGAHSVMAIARNRTSLDLSPISVIEEFYVPEEYAAPTPAKVTSLPAPTMVGPNAETVTSNVKPFITGLTVNGTKVDIYIDGVLNGTTGILTDPSGTANFAYRPFLNLSVGEHNAWTVAENGQGKISGRSNVLYFNIEKPLPAPIIYAPVVRSESGATKPYIVGLTKNDTRIRIYVDKRLDGEYAVTDNPSGTANFAFQPATPLTAGAHLIYVTAVDSRGKESPWSNQISYAISSANKPSIGATGAEEQVISGQRLKDLLVLAKLFQTDKSVTVSADDITAIKNVLQNKEQLGLTPEQISELEQLLAAKQQEMTGTSTGQTATNTAEQPNTGEQATSSTENELHNLLGEIASSSENATSGATGMINESNQQQGKLKLNLIIFILFLLAVIGWIFWVNRELIRERREQNEKSDKTEDEAADKDDKKSDQDGLKL